MGGAVGGVLGAIGSIISSIDGGNRAKKNAQAAARDAEEAAKRNVTVQSSAADPTKTTTDTEQASETNAQNARRRRYGMSNTMNGVGLLSSLTGGRKTLGG